MAEYKIKKVHGSKKIHGGFKKVEKKAAKEYGSEAAGKRVAGAIYAKKMKAAHGSVAKARKMGSKKKGK